MKLFGKKDNHPNDGDIPEAPGADEGFDETGESLTAPTRPQVRGGGGRKGFLVFLLLLLLGGGGGGYYYMNMTMEDPQASPGVSVAQEQVLPADPAADERALAPAEAVPAMNLAGTGAETTEAGGAPSLLPEDPLALPPAEDLLNDNILADAPPMPGEAPSSVVPSETVAAVVTPVDDPLAAPPTEASSPDTEIQHVRASPDSAVAGSAAAVSGPAGTETPAPSETPGEGTAVSPSDATHDKAQEMVNAVEVLEAAETPANTSATELEDLPLPASEEALSLPADAVPSVPPADPAAVALSEETAPKMEDKTAEAPAASATAVSPPPSAGELAIVNNAGALDAMTPPAGSAPTDALDSIAEEAMIRPLPKQYLVVQKNHAGGEVDSRLTSARMALAQGRSQASLQIFNQLYEDHPRDKRVLMGRAVALQKLGQTEAALGAYEEVLNRDPKNLDALTNMLGLLKAENPSLAVEKLLELREAYPYNSDITAQLGIAYGGSGEYEEALKYLDMAEALKPGSAFVLYNRGVLLDRMGRTSEAAGIYRQIVRLAADGHLDQNLPIDTIRRRLAVMR